ncbi:subtilisin-like protease SBT1.7 [Argentina anserina]|uniref:subtilisin-like protease SBT1.7 n=1 Tax=Argentina anserina TaxID=57926 RepID=UPI0021762520|nr:subtilisin-like protease SBT1.7 [Potentilla anserina]
MAQVGKMKNVPLFMLLVSLLIQHASNICVIAEERDQQMKKTYIIQMDKSKVPASFDNDHYHWYGSSLRSVSASADMLYTYQNLVHGFSARLTSEEAELLEKQSDILSVLPEMRYELDTTRTPEFLGITGQFEAVFPASANVSKVVIGVVDTGVWPESKCYNDKGLAPVPRSWKGKCEEGKNFNSSSCNRKLIGARFFSKGYEAAHGRINEMVESRSPRDDDGHGTHTSSIAAGSPVPGASFFGYASGTAQGMAAQARIAAYKACWVGGCFGSDVLAAMDKAVKDGVNILSLSLSFPGAQYDDPSIDIVAIGAFSAMAKGVLVSCSAGNNGPNSYSSSNNAPWVTTVGAGTLDRDFPAYVTLGNGKIYRCIALDHDTVPLPTGLIPIVYAPNASNSTSVVQCAPNTLIPEIVAGKIVVCDRGGSRVEKSVVVKKAGGLGMILANTAYYGEELVADPYLLPTALVGKKAGDAIKRYIASHGNPKATLVFRKTQLGIKPSPVVAAFSSRGPNPVTTAVLKPDLIAPGVNILAGWTGAAGPTGLPEDKRRVNFNIISGTSMSCPHVSGIAALLKAAHPEWSPAAIKSALMTTSYTRKNGKPIKDVATGKPATPFDYGAGHVNPVAALDPGLVYDLAVKDYLRFLCAMNYTTEDIKKLTHRDFTCDSSKKYRVEDFNYPSFAATINTSDEGVGGGSVNYTRTLTNVGTPARYKVRVTKKSPLVEILIEPKSLSFSQANEKKTYTVTFIASPMPSGTTSSAYLQWSDGKHVVGSPIAIEWI